MERVIHMLSYSSSVIQFSDPVHHPSIRVLLKLGDIAVCEHELTLEKTLQM